MEGKGIYYFIDGDKYEGEFKYKNAERKGIFYYKYDRQAVPRQQPFARR